MNESDFEKIDKKLTARFREAGKQPVPAEIRSRFAVNVEKKILERNHQPVYSGFAIAGFAVVFLTLAAMGLLLKARPVPEAVAPATSQTQALPIQRIETPAVVSSPIEAVKAVLKEKEEAMADEIAFLEELGQWTSDDELAVGFSVEESFSEIEMGLDGESLPVRVSPGAGL